MGRVYYDRRQRLGDSYNRALDGPHVSSLTCIDTPRVGSPTDITNLIWDMVNRRVLYDSIPMTRNPVLPDGLARRDRVTLVDSCHLKG